MTEDEKDPCCASSCRVESIVSMDERGQMVLPKEIREKAKIRAGDKMAVVSWEKEEKIFCISLIKVEDLETMVRSFLGPVAEDIIKTK